MCAHGVNSIEFYRIVAGIDKNYKNKKKATTSAKERKRETRKDTYRDVDEMNMKRSSSSNKRTYSIREHESKEAKRTIWTLNLRTDG